MSKHIASSQDTLEVSESSCQAMDKGDGQMELPPGFRFHPTDEELITHYLSNKFIDNTFNATAVGEVDLNKCEPWDLPWRAKMGEKEWYFFCVRDRKYPTGSRANRATESGYWKATGKDKEIHRGKSLVGMKKTLVFYKGRAPRGEKTNWVMHEYRLEGKLPHHSLPKISKSEWVICRVFKKSSTGKKTLITGLFGVNTLKEELSSSMMPPLIEAPFGNHATCFSNGSLDGLKNMHNNDMIDQPFINPSSTNLSDASFSSMYMQTPSSAWMQDQGLLRSLLHEPNGLRQTCKPETDLVGTSTAQDLNPEMPQLMSSHQMGRRCLGDHDLAAGPLEMEYFWNY